MQHSRRFLQPDAGALAQPLARPGGSARHDRLFEMIRQQELSARALERLHHRNIAGQAPSLPSPAVLAATLYDDAFHVTG